MIVISSDMQSNFTKLSWNIILINRSDSVESCI